MLIVIDTQKPWDPREPVVDQKRGMKVRLPPNIEQLWSDRELMAVGLKRQILETPEPRKPEPELTGPEKVKRFFAGHGITVADLKVTLAESD